MISQLIQCTLIHTSFNTQNRERTFSLCDYELTTTVNARNVLACVCVSTHFKSRVSMCKLLLPHDPKLAFAVECYIDLSVLVI